MSKCLLREWREGSFDRIIAPLLSHKILVGQSGGNKSISERRVRSQMASLEHSKAAVYSASQEEVAMVFCFRELQEIAAEPRVKR